MQRHDFLIAPRREDARIERRRSRYGERYYGAGEYPLSSPGWCFMGVAGTYGSVPTTRGQESLSTEQSIDPPPAKRLYLEAMQTLERDRLQPTWGRIQQKGEMDYEPVVVALVAAFKRMRARLSAETRPILEEFVGFVDQIDGDVAYVTLTAETGETLYGEYPAAELKARGIHERRRFKCRTIDMGSHVEFDLEPIPDVEIGAERERAIEEELRKLLGDDKGPQDD